MLPTAIILEIRRLLDESQLSQRQIARKLDVSRGTVGAIANGRRGLYGRETIEQLAPLDEPIGMPSRCIGCGGMVMKPCVLCQARAFRHRVEQLRGSSGNASYAALHRRRVA